MSARQIFTLCMMAIELCVLVGLVCILIGLYRLLRESKRARKEWAKYDRS